MDLLTHALVGAGAGAATRPGPATRWAGLCGAVATLLVDVDYFIASPSDPLLQIEYHRHFSHSLAFIPIGALIAAALIYPLLRRKLSFRSIYLAALAGYATHWMIDICTGYGLHLLWPFSDERFALHIISVIDPAFTLLVGVPTVLALWLGRRQLLLLSLVAGALYLGGAAWQQSRATALAEELASSRGHEPEEHLLRPSFGNILLWRSIYRSADAWHVDAIRPGLARARRYPGGSIEVFDRTRDLPEVAPTSRIARDLERLAAQSDGYLVWQPRSNRVGDIRFSAVPDGLTPMWGLQVDPHYPDAVPVWFTDHSLTPDMRARFLRQLRGEALRSDTR